MSSIPAPDEVLRIAARGDGVLEDGRHVPLSAPGDRLDPDGGLIWGPHHVEPPCQHFNICGGCDVQQLDMESYSQFIHDRVINMLTAQDVTPADIKPVHISPAKSRRRVSVRAEYVGKQFQLGFSSSKTHRIIDLKQCEVMDARLFAMLEPLRELLKPLVGRKRTVHARMAIVDQGIDLLLENVQIEGLDQTLAITEFAQAHGLARLSINEGLGPEARWEPEPVTITFGGVPVSYPADSFLQATPDGEAVLIAAAKEVIGDAVNVADLFAGLGGFGLSLGEGNSKRKVYAAEGARDVLLSLKGAAGQAGRMVFTEHRDLFRRPLMPNELDRFDAVILDPPRAGAREQILQLAESNVSRICYVSCNPSSFARDAKKLVENGYTLDTVWPVGQFRWSNHVELASGFSRR